MIDIRNPLSCEEAVRHLQAIYRNSRDPIAEVIPIVCEEVLSAYANVPEYLYTGRWSKEGPHESWIIPFLRFRLNTACILADNMGAAAELVVASLAGPGIKTKLFYRNTFEPKIGAMAYERVNAALRQLPNTFSDIHEAAARVDDALWERALEQPYEMLLRKARKSRTPQWYYIKQAYALAREYHGGVFRPSGEPYLARPLAIAHILADRKAESELIAAALLAEAVGDSGEEPQDSRNKLRRISPQVARYVEAVLTFEREAAACAKEKASLGADRLMERAELDQASVDRLLSMSREDETVIQAVYLKAAACYHDLQVQGGAPDDGVRRRMDEIEEYDLPVFKAFGIHEFIPAIEDQLWRTRMPELHRAAESKLRGLLRLNKQNLRDTGLLLSDLVGQKLAGKCKDLHVSGFNVELIQEALLPHQVYQTVKETGADDVIGAISKYTLPLLCYSVVESGLGAECDLDLFTSVFVKTLRENTRDLRHVITRIRRESIREALPDHKRVVIELENEMASRILLSLYDHEDYTLYKNGSSEGVVTADKEDDLEMLAGSIRVHRRDDSVIHLPEGATALDFAYAIHEDVGMYAAKASINDSEHKDVLLFAVLKEDDKVDILHLANRAGVYGEPQVKIEWLNHVKTSSARKRITRELQDQQRALLEQNRTQQEQIRALQEQVRALQGQLAQGAANK